MNTILICTVAAIAVFLCAGKALAGTVRYEPGRKQLSPDMVLSISTNHGGAWRQTVLKPGRTVPIPSGATHMNINGIPLDPKKSYRIKEGNVFEK